MLQLAKLDDIEAIDELALCVIQHMIDSEIPQWTLAYPRKEHFIPDIMEQSCYIYKVDGKILGSCTILPENDPPYRTIHSWIKDHSLVMHRVLVHPEHQKQGIAKMFIDQAIQLAKASGYESIKIDTHLENYKMRRFLQKNGFIELEYLTVIDRMAYELVLEDLL